MALVGVGTWAQVSTDKNNYAPYGDIKVKNLWINAENYSNRTQFQAQPFMKLSNNTKQPSAVMHDGIIYVAHSEAKMNVPAPGDTIMQAVVHRFDALTGAALSDLELTLDGAPFGGSLSANNIGVDNFGHFWIMPYRQKKTNTMLYQLNPDTGELTLLATLECDQEIERIDYYDVVGDITLQEAPCNIIGPGHTVEAVYGWHNDIDGDADTWTGFFDGDTQMNFTDYYPSKVSNWGIAPSARFILNEDDEETRYDGDLFYIDGFNQYPAIYSKDGSLVESFEFATESLKADSVLYPLASVNGTCEFKLGDRRFFAYAHGDYNAPYTYDIIIAEFGEGGGFEGMQRCWQIPSKGLGNNNDTGRRLTVVNVEEIEVGGKPAVRMLVYKNANGMAVYEIGEGVEDSPSFKKGDVNGDGIVSGADVTALYGYLLDGKTVAGNPDVSGEGIVSGADVTALYNILLNN